MLLLGSYSTASAYDGQGDGGATIVSIADGHQHVIFNPQDALSLYLEKAVFYKKNGWFTNDNEVAITAKMTISSEKRDGATSDLTLSRVYRFDTSSYKDGRIEVPLKSLPLLQSFNLSGKANSVDYRITGVILELSVSKKKRRNGFSKTLEAIMDASKKLPVPVNPYVQYVLTFGETFSRVVDESIKEEADTARFATFGFRFLPGQKAIDFTEKSGSYAVIVGGPSSVVGVIPLDGLYGKSVTYSDNGQLAYDGKPVRNNYLIIRSIASSNPFLLSPAEIIRKVDSEGAAALDFSKRNNIDTSDLEAVLKASSSQKTFDSIDISDDQLRGAVNDLNKVRSFNSLKVSDGSH